MTQFFINELYRCLQGEGFNIGKPAILVRFQTCNLRCTWCDTPQAQQRRAPGIDVKTYSTDALKNEILTIANVGKKGIRHAMFTGGEPTLQAIHVLRQVLSDEWSVEVETNGTRIPHKDLPNFSEADYARFQWNISPKGQVAGEDIVPEALAHWGALAHKQQSIFLKCVVRKNFAREDLAELKKWEEDFGFQRSRIFLMPEGTSRESQVDAQWLHDVCLDNGYRLAPRLHVILFGNKKGV